MNDQDRDTSHQSKVEKRPIRIAVDAMGGDHAPEAIVSGAVSAVRDFDVQVKLVGDEARLLPLVKDMGAPSGLYIHHASDVIAMDAHPAKSVRRQKDSSIVVASDLVYEGKADALISAGSTGASMAAPFFKWGCIPGIDRPAIASILPTLSGVCTLLDVGAMVDSKPENLLQFAIMGSAYSERVLGIDRPRVGLLNNGEEEGKGSELVRGAFKLLSKAPQINFCGNVEGRDILSGRFDVVVCDGFIGNVVLKFAEGLSGLITDLLKEGVQRRTRSKVGAWLLKPTFRELWGKLDYTEYGGALLLGVMGVCVISHGSSNEKAIKNGIRLAYESVSSRVIGTIVEKISSGVDG